MATGVLEEETVAIERVNDLLDVRVHGLGRRGVGRKAAGDGVGDGPGVVVAVAVGEDERVGELDRSGGAPFGAQGKGAIEGDEAEVGPGLGVAPPGRG